MVSEPLHYTEVVEELLTLLPVPASGGGDTQRSSGTLRYMRLGWGKIPPGYLCRASLGPVFLLRNSTVLTGNDSSIVKILIIVEDARSEWLLVW